MDHNDRPRLRRRVRERAAPAAAGAGAPAGGAHGGGALPAIGTAEDALLHLASGVAARVRAVGGAAFDFNPLLGAAQPAQPPTPAAAAVGAPASPPLPPTSNVVGDGGAPVPVFGGVAGAGGFDFHQPLQLHVRLHVREGLERVPPMYAHARPVHLGLTSTTLDGQPAAYTPTLTPAEHVAASRGDLPELQRLAAAHPDRLYGLDGEERSVLAVAAEAGHAHVVRWLLGRHPTDWPARFRCEQAAPACDDAEQPRPGSTTCHWGRHPAVAAARMGRGDIVDVLLDAWPRTLRLERQHQQQHAPPPSVGGPAAHSGDSDSAGDGLRSLLAAARNAALTAAAHAAMGAAAAAVLGSPLAAYALTADAPTGWWLAFLAGAFVTLVGLRGVVVLWRGATVKRLLTLILLLRRALTLLRTVWGDRGAGLVAAARATFAAGSGAPYLALPLQLAAAAACAFAAYVALRLAAPPARDTPQQARLGARFFAAALLSGAATAAAWPLRCVRLLPPRPPVSGRGRIVATPAFPQGDLHARVMQVMAVHGQTPSLLRYLSRRGDAAAVLRRITDVRYGGEWRRADSISLEGGTNDGDSHGAAPVTVSHRATVVLDRASVHALQQDGDGRGIPAPAASFAEPARPAALAAAGAGPRAPHVTQWHAGIVRMALSAVDLTDDVASPVIDARAAAQRGAAFSALADQPERSIAYVRAAIASRLLQAVSAVRQRATHWLRGAVWDGAAPAAWFAVFGGGGGDASVACTVDVEMPVRLQPAVAALSLASCVAVANNDYGALIALLLAPRFWVRSLPRWPAAPPAVVAACASRRGLPTSTTLARSLLTPSVERHHSLAADERALFDDRSEGLLFSVLRRRSANTVTWLLVVAGLGEAAADAAVERDVERFIAKARELGLPPQVPMDSGRHCTEHEVLHERPWRHSMYHWARARLNYAPPLGTDTTFWRDAAVALWVVPLLVALECASLAWQVYAVWDRRHASLVGVLSTPSRARKWCAARLRALADAAARRWGYCEAVVSFAVSGMLMAESQALLAPGLPPLPVPSDATRAELAAEAAVAPTWWEWCCCRGRGSSGDVDDAAAAAADPDAGVPHGLMDPLLMAPLTEPVVATDGHTYGRASLAQWLASCYEHLRPATSPLFNTPLPATLSLGAHLGGLEATPAGMPGRRQVDVYAAPNLLRVVRGALYWGHVAAGDSAFLIGPYGTYLYKSLLTSVAVACITAVNAAGALVRVLLAACAAAVDLLIACIALAFAVAAAVAYTSQFLAYSVLFAVLPALGCSAVRVLRGTGRNRVLVSLRQPRFVAVAVGWAAFVLTAYCYRASFVALLRFGGGALRWLVGAA